MIDDPITLLERELVAAARRQSAAAARSAAADHPAERPERLPRLWTLTLAAVAIVAPVLAVVVVLALTAAPRSEAPATTAAPGSQAPATTATSSPPGTPSQFSYLATNLGVLRRAQTAADRPAAVVKRLTTPTVRGMFSTADVKLMRLAAVAPWGAKVYLVPFSPPRAPARAIHPATLRMHIVYIDSVADPGLGIYVGGDFGCCAGYGQIVTGEAIVQTPAHPGVIGLSGPGIRLLAIVPDGVARVAFRSPSGLRLQAIVHGNVAAAQTPARARGDISDADTTMTWYDARGKTVSQRVG